VLARRGQIDRGRSHAGTVAQRRVTATDGPFTETKELIAGYALVNVPSLAEAKEHAERFPELAEDGESEIRVAFEPPATA
jgi:hypothetical protein